MNETRLKAFVETWIARDPDTETQKELQALLQRGKEEELALRFAGRLAFGTAGLRGVLGAGPMRMNRLVVRETSAGLGDYLIAQGKEFAERGVVIGYDGRILSLEFAQDASASIAALGIPVYLSDGPVPTPLCAYAVNHYKAAAGVVITASHNPPEYNGYKVYWDNGAQIIPPHDKGIAQAIDERASGDLPPVDFEGCLRAGKIEYYGAELRDRYLDAVSELSIHHRQEGREDWSIAYTPLHGVGADCAERIFSRKGFEAFCTAPKQREPDGKFPTVRFPNPEEPGAMDEVLALAEAKGAAIALANDPDADRLAVAARDGSGAFQMLSGNQIGVLLGHDQLKKAERGVVATTVVSSRMLSKIAASYGAGYFETLTGFKWIANGALERQSDGIPFLFGYEEALGYTIGELVRDKDGISALLCFAEMAHDLAADGKTVFDRLEELYRVHGLHLTEQRSLALDPSALAKGPSLGDKLRENLPDSLAGKPVVTFTDLKSGILSHKDGRKEEVALPPSDVLIFELEDQTRVVVRPSGTEPKIKCYYELVLEVPAEIALQTIREEGKKALSALIERHQKELGALS